MGTQDQQQQYLIKNLNYYIHRLLYPKHIIQLHIIKFVNNIICILIKSNISINKQYNQLFINYIIFKLQYSILNTYMGKID